MPSALTADVYKGDSDSFKKFALRCARHLGYCIYQRDNHPDELPAKITEEELNEPIIELLESAKSRLQMYSNMSISDVKKHREQKYKERLETDYKVNKQHSITRHRCEAMLNKVQAWIPPTAEHQSLKDLMIKQLKETIEWDCYIVSTPEPDTSPHAEWLQSRITGAQKDIVYYTQKIIENQEYVKEQNKWIDDLFASLEDYE